MNEILHEYVHLMTDPAHTAVEFTFVLMDVLIIDFVRRRLRAWTEGRVRHEHAILDVEHGVEHEAA